MKRLYSILLALVIAFATVFSAFAVIPGDINADNEVTADDARTALRASVGLETLTEKEFIRADIDNDGLITASDARTILRTAAGLENLHSHEFTEWKESTPATCTEKGELISVCSCGEKATAEIPVLPHSSADGKWIITKPASCTEEGEIHSACSCGKILTSITPILPHSSADGKWKITKPASCTQAGEVQSVCACGKILTSTTPELPHDSSDGIWTLDKASTCTEKGKLKSVCSCGEILTVELPLLPHSSADGIWTVSKLSTCTKKGEVQSVCVCGEAVTTEAPELPHSPVDGKWTETKAASCTQTGEKQAVCACGKELTEEIPVLPHSSANGKWKITKDATCTEKGEKQTECACGEKITMEIPELQHSFDETECTVCGLEKPENHVNIPRLDFTGNISGMTSKKDVREINVTYTSEAVSFAGSAKLKVQGSSSLAYDKKNYTINLYEDSSLDGKMKIDLGWGKQNKYCLKANWVDKTHARNIISANLAAEVQHKYGLFEDTPHNGTIDGFPIEIYSNGEFLGIYTFNIPKDAWMFDMDEDNPDHLVFCGEGWQPANYFEAAPDYSTWAIEVGEENDYSMERLTELFDFIINSTDEEFINDINNHLSLDSTLNYYLLTEFMFLPDNTGKNMLLVTYDGKLWYPSLYDLDTSWGAYWNGGSLFDYQNLDFLNGLGRLWTKVQTLFADELSERYAELREDILTKEHILEKFNTFSAAIPQETFEKEIERWGTNIPGYDISQIEEYLDYMIPVLDAKYGYTSSAE